MSVETGQTTLPEQGTDAPATGLRDILTEQFERSEQTQTADGATGTAPLGKPDGAAPAAPAETEAQAAERVRNEKGQFTKPDAKQAKPIEAKPSKIEPAPVAQPAALQRPSSWKKELWPVWDKMAAGQPLSAQEARSVAEYNLQRESEFAKGVSTYKSEFEQARPLMEAMQPFLPLLQQHGIHPTTWIQNLGNAHRTLALGAPAQKLQAMARLAQDYGVPLQALTDANAQQQYLGSAQQQQPQQPQQQQERPLTREEVAQEVRAQQIAIDAEREVAQFTASGEHPHYAEVRDTMAQLLDANLATDLKSAYEAAIRHPRHAEIYAAVQEQERAAQETERRSAETAKAQQARARAVSTRTSTPSAGATAGNAKGLRAQLEESFDTHSGGRV